MNANGGLKWKLIAGFVLVFIAGAMTGVFCAAFYAHHFFGEMHPPPGLMAARMKPFAQRTETHARANGENFTDGDRHDLAAEADPDGDGQTRARDVCESARGDVDGIDRRAKATTTMEQQHRRMHMLHGGGGPPHPPGE